MKKILNSFVTLVAAGIFLITTHPSLAQVVPFKSSGENAIYSPETGLTTGAGKATHMGKVTTSGLVIPSATSDPLVLEFEAYDFQFTAANGDQIVFEGGGTVNLIPLGGNLFSAVWSAPFHVVSGTGRFANVGPGTQPVIATAINSPFTLPVSPGDLWVYSWTLNGDIDLGRR